MYISRWLKKFSQEKLPLLLIFNRISPYGIVSLQDFFTLHAYSFIDVH